MARLTPTPTPSVFQFLEGCITQSFENTSHISRYYSQNGDPVLLFPKSALSLRVILEAITNHTPIHLHLPELFCHETIVNMMPESSAHPYSFYPVSDTFFPEETAITTSLSPDVLNVVIVVHYFGISFDFSSLMTALSPYPNCLVIEDAAHHVSPHGQIGQFGAISLFSPHKQLAIAEGAAAILHESLPEPLKSAILTRYSQHLDTATTLFPSVWYFKRWIRYFFPTKPTLATTGSPPYAERSKLSSFSLAAFASALAGYPKLLEQKRRNATLFATAISKHFQEISCLTFPEGAQPFHLVVWAKSPELLSQLAKTKPFQFLFYWPDYPPEVKKDYRLRLIPLHHSILEGPLL